MVTYGYPYNNALRPRITIKTIDGSDTLYTFDAFESSNPIIVTYCDMENAVGETGTFDIVIADHNNLIPKDNIHNVKVFLELGKTQASYQHFLIGYGDIFATDRPQTNAQSYILNGFGSAIQASQLMIHRRETYKKDESDAKVYKIVTNALTKRKWRPLKEKDLSIEDLTGWSKDGISTKVKTVYTVVDKAFVYFSDFLNELCDITGAVWFIDFTGGNETFTLTYNSDLHTNIVIKSGDMADRTHDSGSKTSYIKSAFMIEDNSTTEAGVATRLITTTIADKQRVIELTDGTGSTDLTFKALAQQIVIDNDARRLDSIELRLSKDGEPASPNDRVNGDIVLDNGSNSPTGTVLDEFQIDLGSIKDNADWVEVSVDVSAKKLDAAQSKIWIRLFQRSGLIGDPNHDTTNIVKWHQSNLTGLYSATSATGGGDVDLKKTFVWTPTNTGPVYTVRVNSNLRRLFARTNKGAAKRLRLREQFIPTDFLEDPGDVVRYLSLNLAQTSKGRRGIADFRVTMPNDFLFRPYQWVSFNDGKSQFSDSLQVQRARYTIGSGSGQEDTQIGTLHCDLTLSGLYNTLLTGCSCV